MSDQRIGYVIISWLTDQLADDAAQSIAAHRPASRIEIIDAAALGCGYSAALNLGFSRMPDTDIVVACNSDVLMLGPDDSILALFDADPDLAIVGPRQVNADNRIVHGGIVAHEDGTDWDLNLRHRCWMRRLDDDTDDLTMGAFLVPMIAGSVAYIDHRHLRALGGLPEAFRFYFEDTYLCFLARHRGLRVLYTGAVTWRHLLASTPISAPARARLMRDARAQFITACEREGIPLVDDVGDAYRMRAEAGEA